MKRLTNHIAMIIRIRSVRVTLTIATLSIAVCTMPLYRSRMRSLLRGTPGVTRSKTSAVEPPSDAPRLYTPPSRRYEGGGIAPVVSAALPPFILSAPASVNVTSANDTQIHVTWSPTGTVHHYLIERSASLSGPFVPIATAANSASSYNDTPPSGIHSYLYRVRAVDMFGAPSAPSNMALGTAIAFTDSTLTAGVTEIKKEHIYDLRHTVDAVRAMVPNMGAGSYARSDLYQQIVKAEEINELRNQLKAALDQLNISWPAYQDSPLETGADGTPIRKKHIEQLRERSTYGQSTSAGPADASMDQSVTKRLDPMNRVGGGGEDPLSRNFNWGIPIVSLPGRAGLDLGLSLSYNSLVWTKIDSSHISFDDDGGSPSPGFRLGFPEIKAPYTNALNTISYLLITPSGARVELRQKPSSNHLFESVDSSYLLLDTDSMTLRSSDGTQMTYLWGGSGYECTRIEDRNGNYITIHYDDTFGRMDWVEDTLARRINFSYTDGYLSSIHQTWTVNGSPTEHYWMQFSYADQTINTNFSGLTVFGPQNNQSIHGLSSVTLADGSHYDFSYTSWGQVWKVSVYATSGTSNFLNYRSYDLPQNASTAQTDCPRFLHRYDKVANWNLDTSNSPQEVMTTFAEPTAVTIPEISQPGTMAKVTAPDQSFQKIYYGNPSTNLPWENGLVLLSESYDSSSARQRWVTTSYTQDEPATTVTYQVNPRVLSTDIYDPAGNHRQSVVTEFRSLFGLPHVIEEYGNGAYLGRKIMDYKEDSDYLNRRIIGFPFQQIVYDGAGHLMSRVQYSYDEGGDFFAYETPSTHYENLGFIVGRGNITGVYRYNADNETEHQRIQNIGYNQDGSVLWKSDADGHKVTTSYADSFSDTNNSLNTRAYPTSVTVIETVPSTVNIVSTVQYDYDFGGFTHKQAPSPNSSGTAPGVTTTYDELGRLQRATNDVNAAYTRYVYGPNYVQTYSTIKDITHEAYSLQVFDGVGRAIATASNHPNSTGGYSAQRTIYDAMGRAIKASNPVETSLSSISTSIVNPYNWSATGDDDPSNGGTGWIYTQQSYDWKGRSLVTTSVDNKTRTASYDGCGCAGGEVVTLTDEMSRKQRIYSDLLGRQWKAEVLDASNNVYSTTATIYNGRDQVEAVKSYKGAATSDLSCPTNTCMQSVTTYDGYGRLATRQLPQQTAATSYTYNNDDTVATVTEARGVVATNSYNNRHLLTQVSYTLPSGWVGSAPSVSFGYDIAGNRTSMSDGFGSNTYAYDNLSRMTYESRYYNDLSATYALTYGYNVGGQLASITDPSNAQVSYEYDASGRLTSMPGSGYSGITNFLSSTQYRATGALKSATYGNSVQLALTYTARMQIAQYHLSSSNFNVTTNMTYYDDGRTNTAFYASGSPFDRKYEFDFAARLKEAYSGDEAHGGSAPQLSQANSPYRQTYTYDEWNNTLTRAGRVWTQPDSFYASYGSDNRNTGFQYDATGNPYATGDGNYNYDAAGRPDAFVSLQQWQAFSGWDSNHPNAPSLETTDTFDGAGQVVKHINHTRHDDSYDTGQGIVHAMSDTTDTSYYVHSTVLGGKIIEELDQNGAKTKGYVYSGSTRIAMQLVSGSTNSVELESTNPVTGSVTKTDSDGTYGSAQEPDPLGRDQTFPPTPDLVIDPIASPKMDSPMYIEASWGPSQEFLDNNQARADQMDAYNAERALFYGQRATWQWILHKNPNIGVRGGTLHGQDAINYLNDLGNDRPRNPFTVETNPQQTETFPGAYARIKFLPLLDEGYSKDKQQKVLDTLVSIAENEECASAFASAGLKSVKSLILDGLVIGSSAFLKNPDYNSTSGITEAARQRNIGVVGSTAAQGVTIRDILDDSRLGVQTADGKPRIFLNGSAFGGGVMSLREVLVHELIHAAGIRGKDPGLKTLLRYDDLDWFKPFYRNLLKACE